jgi:hypothetical protein
MLGQKDALATIGVKNLQVAAKFYEGTLGLEPLPGNEPSVKSYKSGTSVILVYESQLAGMNKTTSATWIVGDDLDRIVSDLKGKGVTFEHYDMPGTTRHGDIHSAGNTQVAWFKDPDGNILSKVG